MKLRSCVKMAVCLIPELSERDLIVGNCGNKLRLSHRILNFLLNECEGRTGEYWLEVIQVCTKTTEGQYSPVRLELHVARLVSSLLYGFLITFCFVFASP